ncbi:WYL domain-containing transcriptional regulator [Alteromonas sp. C1M14]|uniref:helix-turn-helix transcriptional regulator n=1 Tax=Alteromonas sp. C1M14 TaxID=2841567 RepID=UPI001C0A4652|nr:WYL domain-containing transcriptional regulator [Alteromonas sp. C1M14]MBU2979348.1 WYL domain-containing transcriptional regulator [Alteromonas sp. C1M14]
MSQGEGGDTLNHRTERNTLSRQWEILRLLPSVGAGITASELVKRLTGLGFNVSKRTVERDLNELSRQFPLLCNDKSKPYGWRWMDNASFDIPNLSISDCVSLIMAEEVISPLLPPSVLRPLKPRFEYAKKHLQEANQSHPLARWTDKVAIRPPSMPLLPPVIDEQVLGIIQSALLDEKQVKVVYFGVWAKEAKTLVLHPLGLIHRGKILYLVATAFGYRDTRLYALQRISVVEQLEEKIDKPVNFSLKDYVDSGAAEFSLSDDIAFKARIHRSVINYLFETPLSDDMQVEKTESDWLGLTATVKDSWQFRWWLRSQGSCIEVIAPTTLRQTIKNEVIALANLYKVDNF